MDDFVDTVEDKGGLLKKPLFMSDLPLPAPNCSGATLVIGDMLTVGDVMLLTCRHGMREEESVVVIRTRFMIKHQSCLLNNIHYWCSGKGHKS